MNLLDEIQFHIDLMYSPIFRLAEEKGQPLWAVLQTIKAGVATPENHKVTDLDELADWLVSRVCELDGETNVYLPLGLSVIAPEAKKSISKDSATLPHVFALDVDVAGDAHKSENLPSPEMVPMLIASIESTLGVQFTASASTGGHGLHYYIAFNRSVREVEYKALKRVCLAVFEDAGFHLDSLSAGGQQLMRAIGTKNINQGGGRSRWLSTSVVREDIDEVMARIPKVPAGSSTSFEVAIGMGSRTTKQDDMKLVGNRLDAVLDPMVLLSQFFPVQENSKGFVYVRPDGTFNDSEQHVKYLAGSGKIAVWGARLAQDAGLARGAGYGAFSLVTTLFCGGDASLAARSLGYLEKQVPGDALAWVESVVNFFDAYRDAEAIKAVVPKPTYRGSRGGTSKRHSYRKAA